MALDADMTHGVDRGGDLGWDAREYGIHLDVDRQMQPVGETEPYLEVV